MITQFHLFVYFSIVNRKKERKKNPHLNLTPKSHTVSKEIINQEKEETEISVHVETHTEITEITTEITEKDVEVTTDVEVNSTQT